MTPNAIADETMQHRKEVRDEPSQVDIRRLHHLLSAEGEEPAGEVRRPLGRQLDFSDLGHAGIVGEIVL